MRYLLIVLLTSFTLTSSAAPLKFGETAPGWQLQDQEGNTIDYHNDSEGKVSVVLFWATWCPYCATLM
ncbi:MAG: redoxin domain-containing protein, partial [Gammaproteobacteria bacterium]